MSALPSLLCRHYFPVMRWQHYSFHACVWGVAAPGMQPSGRPDALGARSQPLDACQRDRKPPTSEGALAGQQSNRPDPVLVMVGIVALLLKLDASHLTRVIVMERHPHLKELWLMSNCFMKRSLSGRSCCLSSANCVACLHADTHSFEDSQDCLCAA